MLLLNALCKRHMIVIALGCASAVAQAYPSSLTEFFKDHVDTTATNAEGSPKLRTRVNYNANNFLITSYQAKLNNDGYEDRIALGMAQRISNTNAKISYNVHRVDNSSADNQTNNLILDLKHRTLFAQHRLEDTSEASTIGLALELNAAQLDLSYKKIHQNSLDDSTDEYRFVSRFDRLKYSATLTNGTADSTVNFSTEFQPLDSCLMSYSYATDGDDLRRQFRSEYSMTGLRLAGEYIAEDMMGMETQIASAIVIEKDTKLAALKLRLEHNELIETPSIFFNVVSRASF